MQEKCVNLFAATCSLSQASCLSQPQAKEVRAMPCLVCRENWGYQHGRVVFFFLHHQHIYDVSLMPLHKQGFW